MVFLSSLISGKTILCDEIVDIDFIFLSNNIPDDILIGFEV